MESLTLNKYFRLILSQYKIIIYFLVGMVILAILAGILIYRPSYKSRAKLMIKEAPPSQYVAPLGEGYTYNYSKSKNPSLNYIEVLASENIAKSVAEKISKDDPFFANFSNEYLANVFQHSLTVENIPGTDIIELFIKWKKPDEAKKITQAYVDAFMDYNVEINKKSVSQMKNYIENQLKSSETELKNIRNEIKEYKTKNQSVNVDQEAIAVIQQITVNENNLAEINQQLSSEKSKSEDLSKKLNLDTQSAIISTALGQNGNLQALRRDLQVAQQKYAEFSSKYTPLNPHIIALTDNITEIKSQIEDQVKLTLGQELLKKDSSIIADPVRTEMVNQLVLSQSHIQALDAQKTSVEKNLKELREKQSSIPEVQATLQTLLQEESTLAAVVETLNKKLVESQIRESEIVSNLVIVDEPSLPRSPTFPTIFHLILIFAVTGVFMGVAVIIGKHYIEDTAQGAREIEEIINAPVLGIIPWLKQESYNTALKEYNPSSIISIIYQKINTSLKIKCMKKNINVIGITSADFEKRRSVISANIAKSLAKSGNSVLLIDADFRSGCLAKEFEIDIENKRDLTDAICDIAKLTENRDAKIPHIVNSVITTNPQYKNLYLIHNNNSVINPDEILNIPDFADLISFAKKQFNYVIIDTPPLLAVSDSIRISQYIDGLILLCGIKTSRSNLIKVKKNCEENYINILGAVARDSVTELEIPENMYIKQLSENID